MLLQTMAARENVEPTSTILFFMFAAVGTSRESSKEILVENRTGVRRGGTERLLQLQAKIYLLCRGRERIFSPAKTMTEKGGYSQAICDASLGFHTSLEGTEG